MCLSELSSEVHGAAESDPCKGIGHNSTPPATEVGKEGEMAYNIEADGGTEREEEEGKRG